MQRNICFLRGSGPAIHYKYGTPPKGGTANTKILTGLYASIGAENGTV